MPKQISTEFRTFIYLLLTYVVGVFIYGYVIFSDQKQKLQNDIDRKLKAATLVASNIFKDSYYIDILRNDNESKKTFENSKIELAKIAKELDVKFVYILVPKDDKLLFVGSSYSGAVKPLTEYASAPKKLKEALKNNSTNVIYDEYSDKWGNFRSVFVPMQTKNGLRYVVGADVESGEIAQIFENSLLFALKALLFFVVLALPAAIFYILNVRKSKKDMLKYFARDTLTGLSNRHTLIKELQDTRPHALMLINLDAFKELNDFYGHEVGDKVLYEVSRRLDNFISKSGTKITSGARLFRLHSDEFAVLFDGIINKEGLSFIAEVILLHLSGVPIGVDAHEVTVNATIGIAMSYDEDDLIEDDESKDAKYFMTSANIALKQAKLLRRPYLFYDSSMMIEQKYEQNITWIRRLKDAIKEDGLVPFYQPILNNQTGKIEKYESLIRLIDDKGFAVSPYHFLDVAKKSRLYDKITKTVIDKSFEMFKDKDSSFSVNLSILDIQNKEIVAFIFKRLEEIDVGERVVFEILESEGIENYDELYSFRERIRLFGSKISIDDFGAGYSNFDHILKLKPDFIKIDGSLIKNIDKDDSARILTKAIVGFANELGSKTIAEFVHSKEVFEVVCELGIDYSQGYFISEPKPHPFQAMAAKSPFDTINTAQ